MQGTKGEEQRWYRRQDLLWYGSCNGLTGLYKKDHSCTQGQAYPTSGLKSHGFVGWQCVYLVLCRDSRCRSLLFPVSPRTCVASGPCGGLPSILTTGIKGELCHSSCTTMVVYCCQQRAASGMNCSPPPLRYVATWKVMRPDASLIGLWKPLRRMGSPSIQNSWHCTRSGS